MHKGIERVLGALDDIRAGKMVVVVDDEHRENEGDLTMAAELVTPEAINFMAQHGRGLICLSMTEERIRRLELPMMVEENRATRSTAFTVSIEARVGVTTGISAADRAHTIRTAVARDAVPRDIVSPGHVFPLKAQRGGVLRRTGHTEGAVDLARLAGREPAGVICEIMKDDGTMARYPDLVEFGERHGLRIVSIADLIAYRLTRERLVRRLRTTEVRLPTGKLWQAHVYDVTIGPGHQMLAMTYGELSHEPTCVRVHNGSALGDIFGVRMGNRVSMQDAVAAIEAAGSGVVLLLSARPEPATDVAYYLDEPIRHSPIEEGEVLREYGLGAQVLLDLGLRTIRVLTNRPRRMPSLEGYALDVLDQLLVKEGGEVESVPVAWDTTEEEPTVQS